MEVGSRISIRRLWIPTVSGVAFVIIGAIAFMVQIYITDGECVPLSEILFMSPACYFWILWFFMIFFSANGFVKEYGNRINAAKSAYPSVDEYKIRILVKKEMAYSYSKTLLLCFAGLPLLYLSQHYDVQTGFSTIALFISIIPFFIDLIIFVVLWYQARQI